MHLYFCGNLPQNHELRTDDFHYDGRKGGRPPGQRAETNGGTGDIRQPLSDALLNLLVGSTGKLFAVQKLHRNFGKMANRALSKGQLISALASVSHCRNHLAGLRHHFTNDVFHLSCDAVGEFYIRARWGFDRDIDVIEIDIRKHFDLDNIQPDKTDGPCHTQKDQHNDHKTVIQGPRNHAHVYFFKEGQIFLGPNDPAVLHGSLHETG